MSTSCISVSLTCECSEFHFPLICLAHRLLLLLYICLLAFKTERKTPGFAFRHSDLFLDPSDSCQEAGALKAGPGLHLHRPAVTQSRALGLALGRARQRQVDLTATPPPLPPRGRHLLGEVVLGRKTDLVTQRPQTPSHEHVALVQGRFPKQKPAAMPLKASGGNSEGTWWNIK